MLTTTERAASNAPDVLEKVPESCLLFNGVPGQLCSKQGVDESEKLLQEADDCNPDTHGCYIFNDYYGYAVMDLIERTLMDLRTICKDKRKGPDHPDALAKLEGLTLFMAMEDTFVMVSDGDRFTSVIRCYAAAVHTIAAALQKAGKLNSRDTPQASNLFMTASKVLQDFDTIGGPISNAPKSLLVMLIRAGLPHEPKKRSILQKPKGPRPARSQGSNPADEDDDSDDSDDSDGSDSDDGESEEEEQRREPPKKRGRQTKNETDPIMLAAMTHEEAEKNLNYNKPLCRYSFYTMIMAHHRENEMHQNEYVKPYGGEGYNLSRWPKDVLQQRTFKQLGWGF